MSIPVLILGASGTGKSTSLRSFKRGEIAVVNTLGKPLPIREQLEQMTPRRDNGLFIDQVAAAISRDEKHKAIMVDDFGYNITEIYMRYTHGAEKLKDQFEVYKIIGARVWNLICDTMGDGNVDRIVYFVMHTDVDANGNVIPATIGKLLNEKVNLVGMFSIVLMANTDGEHYTFATNGMPPAKSPIGMFDDAEIPNDLKAVDARIREFYGYAPLSTAKKGGAK